jgi:hypothetical protein
MKVLVDTAAANMATGYISGIASEVSTDRFVGSVVNYVWAQLAPEFDLFLDELAKTDPHSFMHVYEWGDTAEQNRDEIGRPTARLWKQELMGHGRNKIATFSFKESIKPTPVDPTLLTPGESNGKSVKEGIHIFHMKATVMEAGMQISVSPKLAQYLAFVAGASSGAGYDAAPAGTNSDGTVAFSSGPVTFIAGGGHTTGKFTGAFQDWWHTMAQDLFDHNIAPVLETELHAATDKGLTPLTHIKTKAFSIQAGAMAGEEDFRSGMAKAIEQMRKLEKNYIAGAMARRTMGGYEIDEL